MMQIKVENGMAKVFTPYNAEFVKKIKNIGGRKWNAADKCWMIPESEIETARQYMMDVYGETDLPDEDGRVTIKVKFNEMAFEYTSPITIFGKEIARAWGRDSGAKVGEDVTLLSGSIGSGGSAKNWRTTIHEGSVFKIRNVAKKALEIPNDYNITVEEVEEATIDRKALEEEKAKLLARLAEIEALLA